MTIPDVATRVARGAAVLDRLCPGWADQVDVETLDMAECHRCVLGQVDGHYYDGALRLEREALHLRGITPTYRSWLTVERSCVRLGFDADTWGEYDALTAAWARTVAARRPDGAS